MNFSTDALALALALAAMALFAIQTFRLGWLRGRPARRLRAAALRGAAGEERARALLVRHGYSIGAEQAEEAWSIDVDGESVRVHLRADYLVTRHGRSFVAEVKTGESAPRIEHPPTRRQLLEYRHAFAVDGVLLVHVEAEKIQEVKFPLPSLGRSPGGPIAHWLLITFLVGAAAGAFASIEVAKRARGASTESRRARH